MEYDESLSCYDRARVIPGRSLTRSKAPGRYYPVGCGPLYAERGEGAILQTVDGMRMVDMVCALGAISLGYGAFDLTVQRAVSNGWVYSLPHRYEAEAAELLLNVCAPWSTRCRFVKTGSEALQAAVMVARAWTKRDVVLVADNAYHGWHNWIAATFDGTDRMDAVRLADLYRDAENDLAELDRGVLPNGVPTAYSSAIGVYKYGDIADLLRVAKSVGFDRIAAVVVEPARWVETDPRWLEDVNVWCGTNGSLVIYDEMIYGCRWRCGGAAEYFRVQPDLACFGKAIGNGAPIAAVVGGEPLEAHGEAVSGTYSGDAAALAAVISTLTAYRDRPVIEMLWERGEQLARGLDEAIAAADTDRVVREGKAVHQRLVFTDRWRGKAFSEEMAANNVLWHPEVVNVCYALARDQVDYVIKQAYHALRCALTAPEVKA